MSVKPSVAIASESECLFMIFMDCIGLIKIEVELLLFADEMNQNPFCSRQRNDLRPDHWWINNVVTISSFAAGTNVPLRTLI